MKNQIIDFSNSKMENVTFTIKDKLPANSLVRPLLEGLSDEITMKYDETEKCYLSEHSIYFKVSIEVKDRRLEVITEMSFIFLEALSSEHFYISSEISHSRIFARLFTKCLLKIEDRYCKKRITHNDVRRYPIYQLLENYMVNCYGELDRDNQKCQWKGFTFYIDYIYYDGYYADYGEFTIKYGDEKLYYFENLSFNELLNILEEMRSGTAPSVFYTELPIKRIKSAKTE